MATTGIQRVYTSSSDHFMFVKLEDTGNNRYVNGTSIEVGNCSVPWCESSTDLLKKGIILVNQTKGTLAGYIWQQRGKDGDRVRYSKVGWAEPSTENWIPGFSGVATKINLKIDAQGNVSAEQTIPG